MEYSCNGTAEIVQDGMPVLDVMTLLDPAQLWKMVLLLLKLLSNQLISCMPTLRFLVFLCLLSAVVSLLDNTLFFVLTLVSSKCKSKYNY